MTKLSLALFDQLAPLHRLPASARPLLEVAALLHDIGIAVNYQRHHKHTYYLIQNADLPGLSPRDRELVARVARYHRRSLPVAGHVGLAGLSTSEARLVAKLAVILRLADSLDRSHRQPVKGIRTILGNTVVVVQLVGKSSDDLELWDAAQEAPALKKVLGRPVEIVEG